MREMREMQQRLEDEQAKEVALAASAQEGKKRLLNDLAEQEARREQDVKKLQVRREALSLRT